MTAVRATRLSRMSSVVPLSRIPKIVGVVQAGGQGSRMDVLTRERAKPALPFAGSYQLVDFALSNFGNSGIADVWVSVQYEASSLDRHLAGGRPWDLGQASEFLLVAARPAGPRASAPATPTTC